MTSKERAALRAESHHLEPIFQVGKGGLSEAFYKQVDEALTTRELMCITGSMLCIQTHSLKERQDLFTTLFLRLI